MTLLDTHRYELVLVLENIYSNDDWWTIVASVSRNKLDTVN